MSPTGFGTVMVTLDGSEFAEAALEPAAELAREGGATRLHLVSVHERGPGWVNDFWPTAEMDRWREEYVAEVASALGRDAGVEVTTALPTSGDVPGAILDEARDSGAGLVILSSHGRGRISRSWMGNVAASVLHAATVPLLVLRPEEEEAAEDQEEGEDPPPWSPVRTILVALDGSPESEVVMAPARALAGLYGASLHLVRVAPFPRAYSSPYIPHAVQINQEVVNAEEEKARAYLQEAAARLVPGGRDVGTSVVVTAQPARGILAEAARLGADLLALATHHGTLHRLALGSTADKVVRASGKPILVARAGTE